MNNESKLHKPEDLLSGTPIIGGDIKSKKLIEDALNVFVERLDPIMNNLGQAIAEIQGRLTQLEDLVHGALVDILTERIRKKLHFITPTDYHETHAYKNDPLPRRAKEEKELCADGTEPVDTPLKKTKEEKAWDGEGIKPPEGQLKEVKE